MSSLVLCLLLFANWLTFDGKGKHIVLVSGDDEYRSEQAMPQLARILSRHHGFKTTVLFALDPDGAVNPESKDNIPGLEALKTADLMILFTRFRDLPDDQMKYIVDYVEAGKPIVGIRTATHAFEVKPGKTYEKWSWKDKTWDGGFGRQVLGETWVAHHGKHKIQSTRARFVPGQEKHPIDFGILNWPSSAVCSGPPSKRPSTLSPGGSPSGGTRWIGDQRWKCSRRSAESTSLESARSPVWPAS
jgi:hypothetical protein